MANKIQIKRGLKANLPVLNVGEPAFTNDTKEFFIGDGLSNIEFAKQSDLEITNTHLKDITQKTDKFTEDANKKLLYNGAKVGATNASEINISSINGLSATNTQQALSQILDKANSAFQCANSGKTNIANVVGGGLNVNNTHQELANYIQWCKNDLANLITSKGVGANGNRGLHELLLLVGNINNSATIATGSGLLSQVINLGWKPAIVVIQWHYRTNHSHDVYSCIAATMNFEIDVRKGGTSPKVIESNIELKDNGFIYNQSDKKYETISYYAAR